MTELAKNIVNLRALDQDVDLKQPEKPWERQRNESAEWYMRFKRYLDMGSKRSLRALVAAESGTQVNTREGKNLSDVSVPRPWRRASKLWNWVERAHAYDLAQQERKAQDIREIASSSYYSSKPKRLMELSNLAEMLKRNIKADMEYKDFLATIARLQSVFKDIEALMSGMGETIEKVADVAAYEQYIKDMASQLRQAAESQDNPKRALQDFVNQLRS